MEEDFVELELDKYKYIIKKENEQLFLYEKSFDNLGRISYQNINPSLYLNNNRHYFTSRILQEIIRTTSIKNLSILRNSIDEFFKKPRFRCYIDSKANQEQIISMLVEYFNKRYGCEDFVKDPSQIKGSSR